MASPIILALIFVLPILYFLIKERRYSSKLPPGSLGLPIVGQSLALLRAMNDNTAEQWLAGRIKKYGPISKMSLFGTPTIFLTGPAANKFIFVNDALAPQQPRSISLILGRRNMLELVGDDHRRLRGAVVQFLKPEMLTKYVGKIDGEVKHHINSEWKRHQTVTVLPLMKSLTFDIISSLLFGLERGPQRDALCKDFVELLAGLWAVPVNLPFTTFNKSLRASAHARKALTEITRKKKAMLESGHCSPSEDLITYLLSLKGEDNNCALSEEEIVDNAMVLLTAGHDTSSTLMTFMIRHLANDPETLQGVVHEQEEIAKNKLSGDTLTWNDLSKMKYTWRVAMETLRMIPPIFGSFRRALKDIEFEGHLIPKGWQVFWASNITQMDANIFHEPTKFDPIRFENSSSIPPYCFVAFGGGPRICPGNEFARIEILVTMHYIVMQYKWKLCCKEDTFKRDPMPSPLHGLPIELEFRDSHV
ncbi:cytochrome P450 716B2-like [Ananas comosus]|uniref:Cytochrome P450 716B2-like n=1 Tax=Ananas comosus TaxID=4615 RepID=A0A6P5FII1_ANACO|nr:cytochrome P450 716B2-like [Ananas comosus]